MKKIVLIICALLTLSGCSAAKKEEVKTHDFYSIYENYNVVGNGIYIVGKNKKFGIADSKSGKVYLDLDYDRLEKIDENRVLAAKDGHFSLLSSIGALLKDLGDYGNIRIYRNGNEIRLLTYNDDYYTLLSADGSLITDLGKFDELMLDYVSNDRYVIKRGTLYTVIDENGDKISNLGRYDVLTPVFETNAYIVSSGGKKGVINPNGVTVISITHEDLWKAKKNSCFVVSDGGKLGAYASNGTQIIKPEYEGLEGHERCFAATKDGKVGIIAVDGTVLAPCEYTDLNVVKSDNAEFSGTMNKDNTVHSFKYTDDGFNISE